MSRYQFSWQAGADLELIEAYISTDNPDAAESLILTLCSKCRLLSEHPESGRDRSDLRPGLRGFPVGNYIIFYRPATYGIEVLRILHGARDIGSLFESEPD